MSSEKSTKSTLGSTVKALRERAGLSQQAFATELGMALNTINRYETGSEPDLYSTMKLQGYALRHNQPELAELFEVYINEKWPLPPPVLIKAFAELCRDNPAFRKAATAGYIRMGLSELRSETEKTLTEVKDDRRPTQKRLEAAIRQLSATIGVLDSLLRGVDDLAE